MKDARRSAESLGRDLAATMLEELRSVVLYGSVARGEYIPRVSDINVLILLEDIEPTVLKRAAEPVRRWTREGVAPMLLESREWERASDVFAMELLDMQDAYIVLEGEDPVAGLEVPADALRIQAEREVRTRLARLHTGVLHAADRPLELGALLMTALPSFVTFLRAALRLAGESVPTTAEPVIVRGLELVGAPSGGYIASLEARRRGKPWKLGVEDPLVAAYNDAATHTAAYLDSPGREGEQ